MSTEKWEAINVRGNVENNRPVFGLDAKHKADIKWLRLFNPNGITIEYSILINDAMLKKGKIDPFNFGYERDIFLGPSDYINVTGQLAFQISGKSYDV